VKPNHRFVALGASNLARMALPLLDAVRAAANGPIEVHAALGRGRSYGGRSRLFGRGLGGIDDSGIWRTLAAAPARPTNALVMDVGNDLLYGVDPALVLDWVDTALRRLRASTTHIAVVGLPMPTLRAMAPWRFRLIRSLLVPSCRLSQAELLAAAERLHDGLAQLAAKHRATFHPPPPHWYGFDPIHVRPRCWREALCTSLGSDPAPPTPRFDGRLARLRFLFAAPAERTLFGRARRRVQPSRRFRDGSTLSLW
jgi:hypothetical protein